MSTLQVFDKSVQSLKFLLALRVNNHPFSITRGGNNSLLLRTGKEITRFCNPDAVARFLAQPQNTNSALLSEQWMEWAFMRKSFSQNDLKLLEENVHSFQKTSPCTIVIWAALVFDSLDAYPNLGKWFAELKSNQAYSMAIKEWEDFNNNNNAISSTGAKINPAVTIILDHHDRIMYTHS
jgi:hypothetical protein